MKFCLLKKGSWLPAYPVSQIVLIMKLTAVLCIIVCLQVSASGFSQNVTLSIKDTPLATVFKAIEKQTGYSFFYNNNIVKKAKRVGTFRASGPLMLVLDSLLKDQPLSYDIVDKTIIISGRPEKISKHADGNDGNTTAAYVPLYHSEKVLITGQYKLSNSKIPQTAFDKIIKGKVTDEKGFPLSGVTITVKGTPRVAITNSFGTFEITVPDNGEVLVFSFVGYLQKEVSIDKSNVVDVMLELENKSLEEVTVVGYGTQRKSDLTGSVSSVKGDDLRQLPTQRVDQALQGRAAGVMVLNTDGAPGGNTTIRVRGMNSINGGNNALVVIDGLQGVDLNSINPNDIESIEILKDASATAIYGAQGANGVVLINTRMGKTGKPTIGYNFTYGIQKLRKKLAVMKAADYARTTNEYHLSLNGGGRNPIPVFSEAEIAAFERDGGTDWQDVIYRNAPIQNHELTISGGLNSLKYLVSGSYLNQKGIMLNSDYKRYSLRSNIKADIARWVEFGLTWAGTKEHSSAPPFGDNSVGLLALGSSVAPRWAPTEPVYDADGSYHAHSLLHGPYDTWNPLASTIEPYIDNNTNKNALNIYLDFKLLEGLSLKITGGASISNTNNQSYLNLLTYPGKQNNGVGSTFTNTYSRYQNSNILTYVKALGKHDLNITAVAEQQFSRFVFNSVYATDFLVDQTGVYNLGGANLVTPSSGADERVLNSYMGRLNYGFDDRYLFTFSYRADGSSVFGKNNKWGYFPSGSFAWKASNEAFMRDVNFLSNLKFRASWGITGNQAISPYQTLSLMGSGSNYPYNGTDGTDLGFYIANAANPSLRWESTTQTNIGVDIGVLSNRLTVTADYYLKTTKDLLMPRGLPLYTGFSSIIDNIGSIENKGIEIGINSNFPLGNVNWNSSLNLSANRNKVLDLGGIDKLGYVTTSGGYAINNPFMYLVPGEPFGQMYGYHYLGTWSTADVKAAEAFGQLPGDPRYLDLNEDGTIDSKDISVIGNSFPKFIFGWNNNFSYKNFDISVLLQGTAGNKLFNVLRIRLDAPNEGTSTNLLKRWTPENQDTDVPAIIEEKVREAAGLVNKINIGYDERSSRWVEDASYLRVKTIMLGYTFSTALLNRIHFKSMRVFISGTNLFTFTRYSGYDPEVSAYNDNDAQIGVDYSGYPQSKTVNAGINISF